VQIIDREAVKQMVGIGIDSKDIGATLLKGEFSALALVHKQLITFLADPVRGAATRG
jgi:hypothetical protein